MSKKRFGLTAQKINAKLGHPAHRHSTDDSALFAVPDMIFRGRSNRFRTGVRNSRSLCQGFCETNHLKDGD
ncbi:MAG: hypothetical protein BWK80_48735 [Desulfobacteraceae bacterium IS3]|nr:MAG: hypothetical protein BWK80_48735 [Desulfobacteraceae bacterium IS3]